MIYRCTRAVDLDVLNPDQLKRVREFFAQFDAIHSTYPGLYQPFDTIERFEQLLLDNLQKFLLEYSRRERKRHVSRQTMEAIIPSQYPDNLPRRAQFFGRDKEMKEVLRALSPDDRGWGVVIDGIGGIGKTALAVEAAYRCKERNTFNGFIFISAKERRFDVSGIVAAAPAATTVDEFVNETARAMGQIGIPQLTGDAKQSALLEALRPTRTLLIYDNLETLTKEGQEAIADLLRFLPQGCKAILTSRRRGGEAAVWLRLGMLDWPTARQIIEHESTQDAGLAKTLQRASVARWQELYDETGGSPLALIWTLRLMRARALTFNRVREMLRRGASRESDLQQFIYAEAHKELSANEVAALNALSFFAPSATFEALMAVADLPRTALERVLERLNALALVDVLMGEERYALHPLTRNFVRHDLLTNPKTAHAVGTRFVLYWVDYAKRYGGDNTESYKMYSRLEAEWANLHAAANWLWVTAAVQGGVVADKEAARITVDLAQALSRFLSLSGRWDENIQLDTRAYEAARALSDWRNAGWHAYGVASTLYDRACTDDATRWIDQGAEAWMHTGSQHEQATVMHMRGLIAGQRQDYAAAKQLHLEALAMWRSLKQDTDVADSLLELGRVARMCEDYDAAEQYFHEALEIYQQQNAREEMLALFIQLGLLAQDRHQWSEARKWSEEALPLAREIGGLESIAFVQFGLAKVWEAEGRADLALPLAQEAVATFERLQHRELAQVRAEVESITAALQKSPNRQ